MDILSSQANLAGYKAVIESFANFEKAIPMMMTAAGTVPAAKALVVGAGVAGYKQLPMLQNGRNSFCYRRENSIKRTS